MEPKLVHTKAPEYEYSAPYATVRWRPSLVGSLTGISPTSGTAARSGAKPKYGAAPSASSGEGCAGLYGATEPAVTPEVLVSAAAAAIPEEEDIGLDDEGFLIRKPGESDVDYRTRQREARKQAAEPLSTAAEGKAKVIFPLAFGHCVLAIQG